MILKDALPELRIEGKPQCHIVAIAKEQSVVAASVGCALSRARTGMRPEEMTCAIPGCRLVEVVEALEGAASLDRMMASYAVADAKRFRLAATEACASGGSSSAPQTETSITPKSQLQ